MIEVHHLTKFYGARAAIQDVTFRVERGEIVGFLGPNGAGKSTTMRILAGCLAPTEGTARVAGHDVFEESLEARRSLGYLPEQVPLYPEMRVEEYLQWAGALRSRTGAVPAKLFGEVASRCGLTDVLKKPIGRLSRGYRQRVGLAQAILHNPPVVILDEPTVGLDPRQIIEVRELIRELAGEHTVLLSTHILPEVSALCSRVVIIDQGHIVAEDTPENLSRTARGGERLVVEVDGKVSLAAERLKRVPGVAEVGANGGHRIVLQSAATDEESARAVRREVARCVVESGCGLLELSAERLSLEDVFVRLVTEEAHG